MRVPPPESLKLSRVALLRDVRARLAERMPQYGDAAPDPTDPGWLLLEQAAWLVELLSEQLDRYPYAVLQQLMHVIGGELLPAKPACGVLIAQVSRQGPIAFDDKGPGDFRFMTPQNENKDTIEFVPAEPEVFLSKGAFESVVTWTGSELTLAGDAREEFEGSLPGLVEWYAQGGKSTLFQNELVEFTVATNRPDDTVGEFEQAIKMFDERNLGWLTLEVEAKGKDRVQVTARIDLARPFARTVPGGITVGGDVEADWATLDDSTWTPTVHVRKHRLLPRGLRGMRPMPGAEEGTVSIPDVPVNFPVDELLVRAAAPMPADVVKAIWDTLGNLNTRIASLRPRIRRKFPTETEGREPSWIGGALQSGVWRAVTGPQQSTIAHVGGLKYSGKTWMRLAVVTDPTNGKGAVGTEVYEVTAEGAVPPSPLSVKASWRLPGVLDIGGGTPVEVTALDVEATSSTSGLLVVQRGRCHAFLVNAVLVANMPAVRDGRRSLVRRNIPEPISLLFEDVVTKASIDHLLEDPIPRRAAAALRQLPLARLSVDDQEPVIDWEGLRIDGTSGQATVNAPDRDGIQRDLRPGARIKLDWYRRTDGSWGNVPAGTIRLTEQPPDTTPSLTAVVNPLGTVFGADREEPRAAVDRLFAPAGGLPVLPSDFEARFRQALGQRAEGWVIRVWSYAERALSSTALWPFDMGASKADEASAALRDELAGAGAGTLLVILGPVEGKLSDLAFQEARAVIEKNVADLRERMAAVRGVVVGRFWPLELHVEQDPGQVVLPGWDTTGFDGDLVDARSRKRKPPVDTLLLNAAVTKVVVKEDEWA